MNTPIKDSNGQCCGTALQGAGSHRLTRILLAHPVDSSTHTGENATIRTSQEK